MLLRLAVTLSLVLTVAVTAHARDPWRTEDTWREALYIGIVAADYAQTRQIIRSCESGGGYYERNPLLSRCPSIRQLNIAIGATLIGHIAIAQALPVGKRSVFQWVTIGAHGAVIGRNFHIGLTGRF